MSKLKLRTKPFPHQLKAVRKAVHHKNWAFFFEPRCGKTKAALDSAAVLAHRGQVRKVVVIAPLIALDVWAREVRKHVAVPCQVKVHGEGSFFFWPRGGRTKGEKIKLQLYVVNPDKFSMRGSDEAWRNDYLKAVERWKPDLVIIDESHRFKASGANRSQALWRMILRLRERSREDPPKPWVFLLTGTPSPKGYIDLFSQFRIMDDSIFGTARTDFEDAYCVYGFGKRRHTVVRYRNTERLLKKIDKHATVVTQADAGLAGQEFFNPLYVTLPPNIRRAYDELVEFFLTEIEEGLILNAANAAVRRIRLLQLTGGFTTEGDLLHRAKLDGARDYLSDLREQDEHVVVYARHISEVKALQEMATKLGYKSTAIRGGVSRRDRTEAIRRFQEESSPQALVFQHQAGALAIELTAAAETFTYSPPDSWETWYQGTQRLGGPNQKRPVRHTTLLARGTVDISVMDTLRGKRDMHKVLMRSPRSFFLGM